jgi:hypothetical protein
MAKKIIESVSLEPSETYKVRFGRSNYNLNAEWKYTVGDLVEFHDVGEGSSWASISYTSGVTGLISKRFITVADHEQRKIRNGNQKDILIDRLQKSYVIQRTDGTETTVSPDQIQKKVESNADR